MAEPITQLSDGKRHSYGAEAEALYRTASEGPVDRSALEAMLSVDADGRWTCPSYAVPGAGVGVLEARALAGLFLLGERVVWVAKNVPATIRRFAELVHASEPLRALVRRIYYANGDQRVVLNDGRWLRVLYLTRFGQAGRGMSADCVLLDDWSDEYAEQRANYLRVVCARPNPQLVFRYRPEPEGTRRG